MVWTHFQALVGCSLWSQRDSTYNAVCIRRDAGAAEAGVFDMLCLRVCAFNAEA